MANLIPGLPNELARECLIRIPFQSFPSAILTCKDWKREIESSEFVHRRIVAGYSQPIMVMSQANIHNNFEFGLRRIYRLTVWELKTGKWGELPPIPGFPNGLPTFYRLAVAGLNLVVIGKLKRIGYVVTIGVYVYNFVSGTWRRGEDMPEERLLFVCASDLDRMVYVVGGHDERKSALRSALAYDVVEDKWVRLPDMAMECFECKAFFQCSRLHVFSDHFIDAQGRFVTSFEAFDPATWTWVGPAQDEFMEINNCPRTCMAGEDGRCYSWQGDYVAVLEKRKWVKFIDLPVVLWRPKGQLAWKRYFVLFDYAEIGERNLKMYLLDFKTKQWTNIRAPVEYKTEVQEVCCLEI